MHPDLFLVVYRQQERALTDRLEHERSRATRGPGRRPSARAGRLGPLSALAARAASRRH
ncbi:hypothetical protein [Cellulomonas triticagri]|uniref:hypothetical protein n=1 Tax=Cellulomonas triticagri TaxID=2483352 RepID=UPI0013158A5C|nr:hypothetical protein [Cellulomonas triticagri]